MIVTSACPVVSQVSERARLQTARAPSTRSALPFAKAAAECAVTDQMRMAARRMLLPLSTAPRSPSPVRPGSGSGMCEAQRTDLAAAQAGKITWAQYAALWGPAG